MLLDTIKREVRVAFSRNAHVVQDHQMGRICGPYTLAIGHQVVLDLDCWRGSRGHNRARRVPMENAGLDPTLGRLE